MSLSICPLLLMPKCHYCSHKAGHRTVQAQTSPLHPLTHSTYTLREPTATSAVIPPDFRCLTGRRQGGWGQQAVNTGRDRKSLRTLPLWIFDEKEWGDGWSLPLVKSEPSVRSVCMTANKGWDKQGLDQTQTTANPAVENICPCN